MSNQFLQSSLSAPTPQRDFRARQLDPNRALPIWSSQELLKQGDYQQQNTSLRGISHQQKTGVDKDDEEEFHLKEILRKKEEENINLISNGYCDPHGAHGHLSMGQGYGGHGHMHGHGGHGDGGHGGHGGHGGGHGGHGGSYGGGRPGGIWGHWGK